MATITVTDVQMRCVTVRMDIKDQLLGKVERVEKKTFRTYEALDFTSEFKKRSISALIIINAGDMSVIGYTVWNRLKGQCLLYKLCVVEECRQQGHGKKMLAYLIDHARARACSGVQLWVDQDNLAARSLYDGLGFIRVSEVEDYYAPGRTGIKMTLDFS